MSSVPTIDSGYLRPAFEYARDQGGAPSAILERSALPSEAEHRDDLIISEPGVWHAFELIEELAGRADTGWRIGEHFVWEDLGGLGAILRQCHSLHDLLRTFVDVVNRFSSHARFVLQGDGDRVWLHRAGVPGIEHGHRTVEQFTIVALVRMLRLALGPDWRPKLLLLQTEPIEPGVAVGGEVEIRTGFQQTSIPVLRESICRPIEPEVSNVSAPVAQLRALLEERGPGRAPTIERAAESLGTSVRTLQRNLAGDGLHYSRLIDQVRCVSLRPLLSDPDIPLADVSELNGHADPANLVRFVRRVYGLAPGEVRRIWNEAPPQETRP